jgi:dTDP-D-glucose 4,6-dehydratase
MALILPIGSATRIPNCIKSESEPNFVPPSSWSRAADPARPTLSASAAATNNLHAVQTICDLLDRWAPSAGGSQRKPISFVADQRGHDRRYAIDAVKVENELSWRTQESPESGIAKPVGRYLQNRPWWQSIADRGYKAEGIRLKTT